MLNEIQRVLYAERHLVHDAGATLAAMGLNAAACKQFVFSKKQGSLHELEAFGLPNPYKAIDSPDVLKSNFASLDALFPCHAQAPVRRLVLGFHRTYLQSGLNPATVPKRMRGHLGKNPDLQCLQDQMVKVFSRQDQKPNMSLWWLLFLGCHCFSGQRQDEVLAVSCANLNTGDLRSRYLSAVSDPHFSHPVYIFSH